MKITIKIIVLCLMAILIPSLAMAQADGGGKKKKKPMQTEQTTSSKINNRQDSNSAKPFAPPSSESDKNNQPNQEFNTSTTQTTEDIEPKVDLSSLDGFINGYGYVDLGLPSGLKWATCNVGANKPYEYGDYFAWGEIAPKSEYTYDNSKYKFKSKSELIAEGTIDSDGKLTIPNDVTAVNWDGGWRIPTREEYEELLYNCSWELVSFGNKNGFKAIGPNGHYIFLIAAGNRITEDSHYFKDFNGFYWSATKRIDNAGAAESFKFDCERGRLSISDLGCEIGSTIRPVSE